MRPSPELNMNHAIAVKSFIINDKGELLQIQRRSNDIHKPGQWDIPGGRLDHGEDPYEGLKRETHEEVNLDIDIQIPLDIHHFTRDDGQKITMIIFLCKPTSNNIQLSEEHTEHCWQHVDSGIEYFPEWIQRILEKYNSFIK